MKKLIIVFFIAQSAFVLAQEAVTKVSISDPTEIVFITGAELDTRASFSLKAGLTRISWVDCDGKYCFKTLYQQLYAKYNFTQNAIGAQASLGYSELLGGRLGFDYEYSMNSEKSDFSIFAAGGFDFGGAFSLVLGPKFNLTQNNSHKLTTLHIGLDISPSVFFQTGKANKMLK